ncbi:MAG: hypothetical protein ISN26_01225 [Betaproteobacteria bacterium AqS2]|uniref:Uncharacterized protein n=1 Tax=Candidatus Amphirhobacter heronislandensis TaxID=1732024 RepID=A0A930UDS0_9GAMM|nr:hypothetical protein [Betaproteobacteria bacterium AqS2]
MGLSAARALDQPLFVVLVFEPLEDSLQVLDARVRFQPEQIFLKSTDESLGSVVALDKRTKSEDKSIPNQPISSWKARLTDCDPLSWRMVKPLATPSSMAPTLRGACLASKACSPTQFAERWSMATKTATNLSGRQSGRRHIGAPHLID